MLFSYVVMFVLLVIQSYITFIPTGLGVYLLAMATHHLEVMAFFCMSSSDRRLDKDHRPPNQFLLEEPTIAVAEDKPLYEEKYKQRIKAC